MKKGDIYVPGAASKMGRPPLEVPTQRVVGLVTPETAKKIKALQKKHGCTVGQAIDLLAAASVK